MHPQSHRLCTCSLLLTKHPWDFPQLSTFKALFLQTWNTQCLAQELVYSNPTKFSEP